MILVLEHKLKGARLNVESSVRDCRPSLSVELRFNFSEFLPLTVDFKEDFDYFWVTLRDIVC